jgi:dsDNA-specific endonuclease/ATPase MutS2
MTPGDNDDDDDDDAPFEPPEAIEMEIEDSLDLHTFAPRDVKGLVEEYLTLAAEKGFEEVRIIHGKGTGTLRRIVQGVLDAHPAVVGYELGGQGRGSWGATVVRLGKRPLES